MSGHSKWKKIKRQKSANDLRKGNMFTKLGSAITLAVREGGSGEPSMNMMLHFAIEKARQVNMPNSTIERAIKKGLGEGDSGKLEQVSYELVGKDGIAIIVDCFTDNTNRTLTDIRTIINNTLFKLGAGGVSWQFEQVGQILIEPKRIVEKDAFKPGEKNDYEDISVDELMLAIMDLDGVMDISRKEEEEGNGLVEVIYVYTKKDRLSAVVDELKAMKLKILSASLAKIAKNKLTVDDKTKEQVQEVTDLLEDNQDIETVWVNIDL